MKRLLLGMAMLSLFAAPSMAANLLTDSQMDRVSAGFDYFAFRNTDAATVAASEHLDINTNSFLNAAVTTHFSGLQWLRVLGISVPPPP